MTEDPEQAALRTILEAMQAAPDNPVTRARIMVERQVPLHQRGPGWDRHWRELEAYLDRPGNWSGIPAEDEE